MRINLEIIVMHLLFVLYYYITISADIINDIIKILLIINKADIINKAKINF